MVLHLDIFLGGKLVRLPQQLLGKLGFANVEDEAADSQIVQILPLNPRPLAKDIAQQPAVKAMVVCNLIFIWHHVVEIVQKLLLIDDSRHDVVAQGQQLYDIEL